MYNTLPNFSRPPSINPEYSSPSAPPLETSQGGNQQIYKISPHEHFQEIPHLTQTQQYQSYQQPVQQYQSYQQPQYQQYQQPQYQQYQQPQYQSYQQPQLPQIQSQPPQSAYWSPANQMNRYGGAYKQVALPPLKTKK